jgi:hypothetical protein
LINQQNLGGFVVYGKARGNMIGHCAVLNEVEIKRFKVLFGEIPSGFQPIFGDVADIAPDAMFKNDAGDALGKIHQCIHIVSILKLIPIHRTCWIIQSSAEAAKAAPAALSTDPMEKLVGHP